MPQKTCPECNGEGVIDEGTEDERRCPTCNGSGVVPDDEQDSEEVWNTEGGKPQAQMSAAGWPRIQPKGRNAMRRKGASATLVFAALTILSVVPAVAGMDHERQPDRTGGVLACSLDGVNPAAHPEIFGNAATARQLGFYQTPDRVWHVVPGCHR